MSSTAFKSIVDTVHDSIDGYRQAIDKTSDTGLQQTLRGRLAEREQTLATLNAQLERGGSELVTKGTAAGTLHHLWLEITSLFESGNEPAIKRVQEGENYLAGKMREVLDKGVLDAEEAASVRTALNEVTRSQSLSTQAATI